MAKIWLWGAFFDPKQDLQDGGGLFGENSVPLWLCERRISILDAFQSCEFRQYNSRGPKKLCCVF